MTTFVPETGSTAPSKILILGATDRTGRHLVSEAVSRGRDIITVLVRSPEEAKDLKGAKLVVETPRNEQVLREALKGHNAVIIALGTPASPFREITLFPSPRGPSSAMKTEGVSRLVAITGTGTGDCPSVYKSLDTNSDPGR